jgi:hypothetical protein
LQDLRKKVSDNFAAVLKINIGKLTWLLFSTICCMGKFERLWENPDVNFYAAFLAFSCLLSQHHPKYTRPSLFEDFLFSI